MIVLQRLGTIKDHEVRSWAERHRVTPDHQPASTQPAKLPTVPKRLTQFDWETASTILSCISKGKGQPEVGYAHRWIEKLRRFVELYRPRYLDIAIERFGDVEHARAASARMASVLSLAGSPSGEDRIQPSPDLASLNAALWLFQTSGLFTSDWLQKHERNQTDSPQVVAVAAYLRADRFLSNLPHLLSQRKEESWVDPASRLPLPQGREPSVQDDFSVVVFSPEPHSLYTLTTLSLLLKRGVNVKGVIVRSMFSLDRVKEELRFGGKRLARKIWRKLILKRNENPDPGPISLEGLVRELRIETSDARQLSQLNRIPILQISDFNESSTLKFLHELKPDYGVFTGGGIMRSATLDACGNGILNCHPGVLPQYKGMDVVHWAVLEGAWNHLGATVHVMNKGIDTGPVLNYLTVDSRRFKSLGQLRNGISALKVHTLVDTVLQLREGRLDAVAQPKNKGRQYFMMTPILERYIDPILEQRHRLSADKAD